MNASRIDFAHNVGDLVLVRWKDERIYFAKVTSVSKNRRVCGIVFEDDEHVSVSFEDIYSVDSSADEFIVCIICKFGTSNSPNQIVLCDKCGVAYHQLCHHPNIPDTALELNSPWVCRYCELSCGNPHVKGSVGQFKPFSLSKRKRKTTSCCFKSSDRSIPQSLPGKRRRHALSSSTHIFTGRKSSLVTERRRKLEKTDFSLSRRKRFQLHQVANAHKTNLMERLANSKPALSEKKVMNLAVPAEGRKNGRAVKSKVNHADSTTKQMIFVQRPCKTEAHHPQRECRELSNDLKIKTHSKSNVESQPAAIENCLLNQLSGERTATLTSTQSPAESQPVLLSTETPPGAVTQRLQKQSSGGDQQKTFPGSICPVLFPPVDDFRASEQLTSLGDLDALVTTFNREHDNFMLGLSRKNNNGVAVDVEKLRLQPQCQGSRASLNDHTTNAITQLSMHGSLPSGELKVEKQLILQKPLHKSDALLQSEARELLFNHGWVMLHKKGLIPQAGQPVVDTHHNQPSHICVNCGVYAEYLCSVCQQSWYCSRECQDQVYLLHCFKCVS